MRLNFITRYHGPDPASLAVGATSAGIQSLLGLIQGLSGNKKAKDLLDQRRAFKTPEQIFKILQANESIQGGFNPQTLQYLTNQTDRAFSSSLTTAENLGADPNQLSNLFDQKLQSIIKIGAENQLESMKNFGKYTDALGLVADNAAAEQKSQQDIIKDKLQAAGYDKQAGTQNFVGGINALLATLSAKKTNNLYTQSEDAFNRD
jgi:hypothetical protein